MRTHSTDIFGPVEENNDENIEDEEQEEDEEVKEEQEEEEPEEEETTMGDKSVETLCHFRVLKANFFSNLYNTTPSPLLNVEFPVSRICLFLVQH